MRDFPEGLAFFGAAGRNPRSDALPLLGRQRADDAVPLVEPVDEVADVGDGHRILGVPYLLLAALFLRVLWAAVYVVAI